MSENPWRKLSSEYVHQNPWYRIRQDKVIRPDGKEGTYNVLEKSGPSVFILAFTEEKELVLINIFRYTTQKEGWEVPAGGVNKDEKLQAAAERELKEETGYTSDTWRYLGSFDAMNSVTDAECHVFVADNIVQTNENQQAREGIQNVAAFTLSRTTKMISSGEISDGLSIAAIYKMLATDEQIPESN